MFIKKPLKTQTKLKNEKLFIITPSISTFPDKTKIADFLWKSDHFNQTHGVCYVIYIFFEPSLVKVPSFIIVGYVLRDFREEELSTPPPYRPSMGSPAKAHPE